MRSMLTHAYNWHITQLDTKIPLTAYVDGWGRKGDTALIAIEDGLRLGAGWYRLFRAAAPGYGFVDEETPELTIAVVPGRRGEGIGHELLGGLIERAQVAGTRRSRRRCSATIPRSASSSRQGSRPWARRRPR